ncbi:hypothetical protein FGG08_003288 [Glutinoglossum americanum]|uniref:Uncharacterized protein n=1 Tax=Glutinoglossum americanum TaxID=1670608 RepID=A0A9P8IBE7_9PEZI|nr:hypothetical protein FGG08_003288 [Glutinoglossum americanum]
MATFVPISYTYVPTGPRSKSATARRRSALKLVNIFDEIQRIKPSGAAPNTPQPAPVANNIRGNKLGIREAGMVNDGDDECDLLSIKQLLYTALQKEGFAAGD